MSSDNTLLELLKNFDTAQEQPLRSDDQVATILRAGLAPDQKLNPGELAEFYAFTLIEESLIGQQGWGSYYGPRERHLEDGSIVPEIKIEQITPDVINYWESRVSQCENPILQARYSGLVWELSKKIRNTKPDYKSIGFVYVRALLKCAKPGRYLYSRVIVRKLSRALSLAMGFKDQKLIKEVIDTIMEYVRQNGDLSKPGIWKYNYELIVKNNIGKINDTIVQEVVADLETRFAASISKEKEGILRLNEVECGLELLIDYYTKTKQRTELERVIRSAATAYEAYIADAKPLNAMAILERLRGYYLTHGLNLEAEDVYKRMQQLSPEVYAALKPVAYEFTVDRDEIDNYIGSLLTDDFFKLFSNLALGFIPPTEDLGLGFGSRGIFSLLTRDLHDGSGRRVAKIGSIVADASGHVVSNQSNNMSFLAVLLNMALKKAKEMDVMELATIMQYLRTFCLISSDRYQIIQEGISAYLIGNYIVAIHVLVPQFEAACLRLVQINGGSIWREGRNGGENLRILDDVLRDPILVEAFGEDICLYFRTVFTDNRGWNIRNKVCHGLMKSINFTEKKADRIFATILLLGEIKLVATENGMQKAAWVRDGN